MTTIATENALAGTTDWELTKPVPFSERDPVTYRTTRIEGYASKTSVNIGDQIKFYVSTTAATFSIDIYRMGYYAGKGGRHMTTISSVVGKNQPVPTPGDNHLIDCDWEVSHTLTIPAAWVSGYYLAKLTTDTASGSWQSYIIFVVRDDARASAYLFQSAVTTYQAYNGWGNACVYPYNGTLSAKLSFNRPYFAAHYGEYPTVETTQYAMGSGHFLAHFPWKNANGPEDCLVPAWEYNMVRWLEQRGEDVTYCTNIDLHEKPDILLSHKLLLSVGHDEYWSREMRMAAELGRDQGINLAFFSGNRVYRQIRLEADARGNANRILVCFKDQWGNDPVRTRISNGTASDAEKYPYPAGTCEFSDSYVSWPETTLLATTWVTSPQSVVQQDLNVTDPAHWIYAGSGATSNQALTLMAGYEIDGFPNPSLPKPGTTRTIAESSGNAKTIEYIAESGASVFVAGTIQWSWGLDDYVVRGPTTAALRVLRSNDVVKKMTANILARATQTNLAQGQFYQVDGAGAVTSFGSAASGWRSKWQIASGDFISNTYSTMLYYDPTTGDAYVFGVDGAGNLVQQGSMSGWRKTWRVVPGRYSSSGQTDLLLHDGKTGEIFFFKFNGASGIVQIGQAPENTWISNKIISGKFKTGSTYSDLLVYNPVYGTATFFTCNGSGGMTAVNSTPIDLGKHKQIIVGNMGTGSGLDDLLVYDSANGGGQFMRCDGAGGVQNVGAAQTGWRKTWKIIPGRFKAGAAYDSLLFYDQAQGEIFMFHPKGTGGMSQFGTAVTGLPKALQLIAGKFKTNSTYTDLLFYNRYA